ncbi:MAG: hypothetical protein HQM10_10005 [Candidatus Riflebacteria bacterium]|nr:hypothetical protein [Candidatus Riflebacteria bacterium]
MSEKSILKKILAGILGAVFSSSGGLPAQESTGKPSIPYSRETILDSLRKMNRTPEKIETVHAMCYKMAMPPKTIEYSCPKCSERTTYPYRGFAGAATRGMEYLSRLASTSFNIATDFSSLCKKCNSSGTEEIRVSLHCQGCSKNIEWSVSTEEEIELLATFFLEYPVKEVDLTRLSFNLRNSDKQMTEAEKIRELSKYIHSKVFCDECCVKFPLLEELPMKEDK